MIPFIRNIIDIYLPKNINYWFINENNKIKILSDAIYTPNFDLINLKNSECWLIKKSNSVVRICEEGKEDLMYSNDNAVDFVRVEGEIYPVERKGKYFLFNGEKFSNFSHFYSYYVFENKDKIIIVTNGKLLEIEKPLKYRFLPTYLSLVYESSSKLVSYNGDVKSFNKGAFYLGTTSIGQIYQTFSGKIITEKEYDLLGVCSSDAYLLGEASAGIVIVCNNKAKVYYKGGWSYLSNVSSITSSYVNSNFIILSDTLTTIYSGNLEKLFELYNVHSITADNKYLYVISNSRKIYVVEPSSDEIVEIVNDKNSVEDPIILRLNSPYVESINFDKLIKIDQKEIDSKIYFYLEPNRLSSGSTYITIENELFKIKKEIRYKSDEPKIDLIEGYIYRAIGGRLKGEKESYNSIVKLRISYNIPTRLGSIISIKIKDVKASFNLTSNEGEISVSVPLLKLDNNEEIVNITLIRENNMEINKEYVIRTIPVTEKGIHKSNQLIENAAKRLVESTENGTFEWVKLYEYQDKYDNVRIAKEGNNIDIEGKTLKVNRGRQLVSVTKKNYKRDYIIYGIPYPVKSIKADIFGNELLLKLDLIYNTPITIIYGTQIQTRTDGNFVFKLDPAYSTIYIQAYYSNDIKWNEVYLLEDLFRKSLELAIKNSLSLFNELDSYGILSA